YTTSAYRLCISWFGRRLSARQLAEVARDRSDGFDAYGAEKLCSLVLGVSPVGHRGVDLLAPGSGECDLPHPLCVGGCGLDPAVLHEQTQIAADCGSLQV